VVLLLVLILGGVSESEESKDDSSVHPGN